MHNLRIICGDYSGYSPQWLLKTADRAVNSGLNRRKCSPFRFSKGDFTFAMARQVPPLMEQFEQGPLREFTPCLFTTQEEIVHALSVVHTEMVLIHPFREGNGRLARMLTVLMGLQAGLPPFDFGGITGRIRQEYFTAVQAGLDYNYTPMEEIFRSVLRRTLRQQKKP